MFSCVKFEVCNSYLLPKTVLVCKIREEFGITLPLHCHLPADPTLYCLNLPPIVLLGTTTVSLPVPSFIRLLSRVVPFPSIAPCLPCIRHSEVLDQLGRTRNTCLTCTTSEILLHVLSLLSVCRVCQVYVECV